MTQKVGYPQNVHTELGVAAGGLCLAFPHLPLLCASDWIKLAGKD